MPMLDVTTTITVNGDEGARFLASLENFRGPVPRALQWLAEHAEQAVQVDRNDAALIADFIGELLASGWIDLDEPPLLFSPRVGDEVTLRADVLAELARHAPGLPPTWQFVHGGATGRLLGWRGENRAIVELDTEERRCVVFVGTDAVVRVRQPGRAYRRAG
jgi:hypothetical protein